MSPQQTLLHMANAKILTLVDAKPPARVTPAALTLARNSGPETPLDSVARSSSPLQHVRRRNPLEPQGRNASCISLTDLAHGGKSSLHTLW